MSQQRHFFIHKKTKHILCVPSQAGVDQLPKRYVPIRKARLLEMNPNEVPGNSQILVRRLHDKAFKKLEKRELVVQARALDKKHNLQYSQSGKVKA